MAEFDSYEVFTKVVSLAIRLGRAMPLLDSTGEKRIAVRITHCHLNYREMSVVLISRCIRLDILCHERAVACRSLAERHGSSLSGPFVPRRSQDQAAVSRLTQPMTERELAGLSSQQCYILVPVRRTLSRIRSIPGAVPGDWADCHP